MTAVTGFAPLAPPAAYLFESIPHIVWTASIDGRTTWINTTGEEFAGLADGRLVGPLQNLVHPDDLDRVRADWLRAVAHGTDFCVDCRLRRHDGAYRWHVVRARPLRAGHGNGDLWVGTATDIHDQQQLEATLRRSEREADETLNLLEAIDAATPVAFKLVDRDFRIVRVNRRMAQLNGRSVVEHVGRTVEEMSPAIWAKVGHHYHSALDGVPAWNVPLTLPAAPQRSRTTHWLTSYFPVRVDDDVIGVGNIAVDVTDQIEADEFRSVVMDNMAEGLYVLDAAGRFTYANDAAQKMLGWTADELRGRAVHEAIHVQRADGSTVPVEQCHFTEVVESGRPVRSEDEAFTRRDGSIFPVALSAAPLRLGDAVHGVVVVFRDVTEERNERATVQRELAALNWIGRVRDALDEQRLELHAQPIVPLHGSDRSEELLLRMRTPSGDLVRPVTFLPVAEKYGLILEIDQWVIRQAARRAAAIRSTVEVNISAKSIATAELLPYIQRQIEEAGADPSHLVFEVTETELMSDMAAGEAFALRLADLGCGLALDDFGTGYGSFTYLKRLSATHLKIDAEFVRDLPTNTANRHVVSAIVDLGRAFGMRTVAEGVEDAETLSALRELGVDYAQGYFVGEPQPIG